MTCSTNIGAVTSVRRDWRSSLRADCGVQIYRSRKMSESLADRWEDGYPSQDLPSSRSAKSGESFDFYEITRRRCGPASPQQNNTLVLKLHIGPRSYENCLGRSRPCERGCFATRDRDARPIVFTPSLYLRTKSRILAAAIGLSLGQDSAVPVVSSNRWSVRPHALPFGRISPLVKLGDRCENEG